jgi:hypothetical protein
MATEGMNGPVVRGDTGPGGSSCVVMATEGMNGPVVRGDTGPGGSSCIVHYPYKLIVQAPSCKSLSLSFRGYVLMTPLRC